MRCEIEPLECRSKLIVILGGLLLAGGVALGIHILRRHQGDKDPLVEANDLISHCQGKIDEIESSLADIKNTLDSSQPD